MYFFQAVSSMSDGCFAVMLLSLFSKQLLTLPQITPLISDGKCLLVPVLEFPSLWPASNLYQSWQDLISHFMPAQSLWQPLGKNFFKVFCWFFFFLVLNNYPLFIEHCSIMLHLLYIAFQIQLHIAQLCCIYCKQNFKYIYTFIPNTFECCKCLYVIFILLYNQRV